MLLGNNILAIIVALVVSAEALSPDLGRGSYTYDPDSIHQNERILRLFLRLASETANHLIRLKNEFKLRQNSTTPDPNESTEPGIVDHGQQLKQSLGFYDFDAVPGKKESNNTIIISRNDPQLERANEERTENLQISLRKLDNQLGNEAHQESHVSNDTHHSKNIFERPGEPENSSNTLNESAISFKSSENATTGNTTDQPVDIANRMMINVEKNKYVSHEHTKTVSNADTKITTIDVPFSNQPGTLDTNAINKKLESQTSSQNSGISSRRSMIASSNAESGSDGKADEGQILSSSIQAAVTSSSMDHQDEISNLRSSSEDKLNEILKSVTSEPNADTLIGSKIGSNIQVESGGTITNDQSLVSKQLALQSRLQELAKAAQANSVNGPIGKEVGVSADLIFSQKSNVQPGTKEIFDTLDQLGSNIRNRAEGTRNRVITAVNAQDVGSKILNSANEKLGNRISATVIATKNEDSRNPLGTLHLIESGGPLLNLDRSNALTNLGSSLGATVNKAASAISNVGDVDSVGSLLTDRDSRVKIVQKIHDPAISVAQSTGGQAGKMLGDLINVGTKYVGSLIPEKVGETIDKTDANVKFDNSNSMTGTGVPVIGDMTNLGSGLIKSLPFFRTFPDPQDHTPAHNNDEIGLRRLAADKRKPEDSEASLARSKIIDESKNRSQLVVNELKKFYDDTDNEVSELELHDYTNRFANALQPLESGRTFQGQNASKFLGTNVTKILVDEATNDTKRTRT